MGKDPVVGLHKGLEFLSAVLTICQASWSKPGSLGVTPQTSTKGPLCARPWE